MVLTTDEPWNDHTHPTPPHPTKIKKCSFPTKIQGVESEIESPDANGEGGEDLATIAKDEKIQSADENWYQDHICYDEPENHPLEEQRQRGGAVPSNWCHEINLTKLAFRSLSNESYQYPLYTAWNEKCG